MINIKLTTSKIHKPIVLEDSDVAVLNCKHIIQDSGATQLYTHSTGSLLHHNIAPVDSTYLVVYSHKITHDGQAKGSSLLVSEVVRVVERIHHHN